MPDYAIFGEKDYQQLRVLARMAEDRHFPVAIVPCPTRRAASGLALQAAGRAKFSTSGVASIPSGSTSLLVSPGVNVTASSFVLLTPKTNIGARALWFTTDPAADTFTIRMSAAKTSTTRVAWLLLG